MLLGEDKLPWEGELRDDVEAKLGPFKKAVLRLLLRDPKERASMESFHAACSSLFSASS